MYGRLLVMLWYPLNVIQTHNSRRRAMLHCVRKKAKPFFYITISFIISALLCMPCTIGIYLMQKSNPLITDQWMACKYLIYVIAISCEHFAWGNQNRLQCVSKQGIVILQCPLSALILLRILVGLFLLIYVSRLSRVAFCKFFFLLIDVVSFFIIIFSSCAVGLSKWV